MLTEDGIRYRVHHRRRRRKILAEGGVDEKGGTTVVEIVDDEGVVLASAEARCRGDERFNRALGREIALGRARKVLQDGT